MRDLGRIVGHIPARGGSKRVPAKNLRYLCDRPLLAYAIECALRSEVMEEIYVNTDSETIAALAQACGANVYRRDPWLASDTATGDDFTADFIKKMQPNTLIMINPVCPLVEPLDVRNALDAFREVDCDTLITCQTTQMQTFCEGRPVNIDLAGPLPPSQGNPTIQILNWAVTIWDAVAFLEHYADSGSGYLGRSRMLFPIDPTHGIKISHEEDFRFAESVLRAKDLARRQVTHSDPRYWRPENASLPWTAGLQTDLGEPCP